MSSHADTPLLGWSSLDPATQERGPAVPVSPLRRPLFHRPAREHPPMPDTEFSVDAPPPAQQNPATDRTQLLLQVAPLIVMVAIAIALAAFGVGGGQIGYVLLSLLLVGVSVPITLYSYHAGRRRYRDALMKRERHYRSYLGMQRTTLERLKAIQRRALLLANPAASSCSERIREPFPRLWERSPTDPDFLDLRLGTGSVPASFNVKAPAPPSGTTETDPLLREGLALADQAKAVDDSPVLLQLTRAGVAAIVGPRHAQREQLRALTVQLATHHSPAEVKLVVVYPAEEERDFSWVRWLPHVWSDDGAGRFVADSVSGFSDLLGRGEEGEDSQGLYLHLKRRKAGYLSSQARFVFLIAHPTLVGGTAPQHLNTFLSWLAREGPAVGAYSVFAVPAMTHVPRQAKARVEASESLGGPSRLVEYEQPQRSLSYRMDALSAADADAFARHLAPVRLRAGSSEPLLQQQLPILDALGAATLDGFDVIGRWRRSRPLHSLAVPVGVLPGGRLLSLDLHERGHGPHGLVVGMTRWGKTSFLRTYLATLAMHFSPEDVAFLIIDFKGGDLVGHLSDLPHVAGKLTNLQPHLARRALLALQSEIRRREEAFQAHGRSLEAYRRERLADVTLPPIPQLIVVCDEFRELAMHQNEFIPQLITLASVGGGLGIHLLLATQDPSGVVSPLILANMRVRICFRTREPQDSTTVLGRPDAADIPVRGRGFVQVGSNEVFECFQGAWAPHDDASSLRHGIHPVAEVHLDGRRVPVEGSGSATQVASQVSLGEIVAHVRSRAEEAGIPRARGPWLDPLPTSIPIEQIDGSPAPDVWLAPVVGIVDDPENQRQPPLRVRIGDEGHILVVGAPGTGRTTFIATMLSAIAKAYASDDVQMYIVDAGTGSLRVFEALRHHVGAVITPDESDRMRQFVRLLEREIRDRKARLAKVGTLRALRASGDPDTPADWIVVVDNYGQEFEETHPEAAEAFQRVSSEGKALGIHLVETVRQFREIPFSIRSNFALRLAFELNDDGAYMDIVGKTRGLTPEKGIPGRGLVSTVPPLECQIAVPLLGFDRAGGLSRFRDELESIDRLQDGRFALSVPGLPALLALDELVPPTNKWRGDDDEISVPIAHGIDTSDTIAVVLTEARNILITGPKSAGKTTLLETFLLSAAEAYPPERLAIYAIGARRKPDLRALSALRHIRRLAMDASSAAETITYLKSILDARIVERAQLPAPTGMPPGSRAGDPAVVLAIADLGELLAEGLDQTSKDALTYIIGNGPRVGLHTAAAAPVGDFIVPQDAVVRALTEGLPTGFVLGTSEYEHLNVLKARLPRDAARTQVAPGKGFWVLRGEALAVQTATHAAGRESLMSRIERINCKTRDAIGRGVSSSSSA